MVQKWLRPIKNGVLETGRENNSLQADDTARNPEPTENGMLPEAILDHAATERLFVSNEIMGPYICDRMVNGGPCGKRFTKEQQLTSHWEIHTGETKYISDRYV